MAKFAHISALLLAAAPLTASAAATDISFSGNVRDVITVTPERNTGLDAVYVLYSLDGVSIDYATSSPSVNWLRYSNLGGGFAEAAPGVERTASGFRLTAPEGDTGYIIEDGDRRTYFWLTDYSAHRMTLSGVTVNTEESDCDRTALDIAGTADAIHFFTINGRQETLERQITIEYNQQSWPDGATDFETSLINFYIPELVHTVHLVPPVYCSTYFTITGDRFRQHWGEALRAESDFFQPTAVDCRTTAEQQGSGDTGGEGEEKDPSNQTGGDNTSGLGGSAPADISFRSFTTDAVIHHEWQMATDPDFENITYRFNERDLDFTFMEQGVTYVRYVGSNADGSCQTYGDVYEVQIGDSELRCPNAFSPGASEGVNDEWKVSYRSLVEFECWIFDRYGHQLFHFTDPSKGWDGKYKGKLVKSGVYYYVIQARGADGRKYKKSGDINIINYKQTATPGTNPVE